MTDIMPYGTEDTNPPAEPLTREEQYLSAIAGVTSSSDIPEKPLTRVEKYLNKIVENGGGGGGGTTDYTQLSNKPQINSHELSGNKTSSDLGLQDSLTEAQLAAVNSGITAEKLQQDETNISSLQTLTQGIDSTGNDFIEINGKKLYFSTTTPSNPSDGDWWLD